MNGVGPSSNLFIQYPKSCGTFGIAGGGSTPDWASGLPNDRVIAVPSISPSGMDGPNKYLGKDCGDPKVLSSISKLELRYTEKAGLFSLGSPWLELTSAAGNVGFYNQREQSLVTRFGRYSFEYAKNRDFAFDLNQLTKLNGEIIIRGIPVRAERWWDANKIEYYDFNDRKYSYDATYLKGLLKPLYHLMRDSTGAPLIQIGAMGPYKPVSFDFWMRPDLRPDETAHALLFMLLRHHFLSQSSGI